MPCIAALIVLGILSIFSAKYRTLAKEAVDCVFRRVTLRPCTTGFDTRIKATILSKLLTKSPALAQFIHKRYEAISWIFVASFLVSLVWTGRGMYLFWATGNCNGLNQSGFCAFDPTGKNNEVSGAGVECRVGGGATGDLTLKRVNLSAFPVIQGTSDKHLVFIGCYACKYTKETFPVIKKLIDTYHPSYQLVFYPTHKEADYLKPYDYCVSKVAVDKYIDWAQALYAESHDQVASEAATLSLLDSMGILERVQKCINEPDTPLAVQKITYEIDKTGIYGTPTVFLDGTPVVGPKPYRVYRQLLNRTWF